MPFPRIFASKTPLLLAILALISMPALAQLTVSTTSVPFAWTAGTMLPQPQTIAVSGVSSYSVAVTGTSANLFSWSVYGNQISVGLNGTAVSSTALANGTYTATLTVTSGSESKNVTLTLLKGSTFSLSLSQSAVSLYSPTGSTTAVTQLVYVTPSPATEVSYTTSVTMNSGSGWLSVTPASGTLASSGTGITITASPGGLTAGTYTGSVTVNAGGGSATITVSLTVGSSSGTLTVSPAAMSFAYTTGSTVPAQQRLTLYAPAAAYVTATAATSSNTPWLLVNGLTTTGSFYLVAGQTVDLLVSVSPSGLTAGTHYGTITVTVGGVTQSIVQVTLNVNSTTGASVSPTTLTFNSTTASAQPVSVIYSGDQTGLTYTATPSTGWLTVSPASGNVNTSFYVYANTSALTSGTYTGYVTVNIGASFTQTIAVTLTIGGSGTSTVFGVGPSSLTFNAQSGIGVASQPIAINGPSSQYYTATATTNDGASWLLLSTASGVMPGTLTVSVNPTVAGTGTKTGTIAISSSSGTAYVYVTLNVQATPVLTANPGGIVVTYDPSSGTLSPQNFYLSSSAPSTTHFTYTASTSTSWLLGSVYSGGGATDSTDPRILVVPTASGLVPGINSGSVTVTGTARNGSGTSTVTIPVTIIYTGTGALTFSPSSLTFAATQGSNPATQTVSITSAASTNFSAYATTADGAGWLTVSAASSYSPTTLTVSVTSASLPAGAYTGTISVTASGYTQTIPVTLTVSAVATATLSLDNVALNFDYQQGASTPASKSIQVTSSGSQVNINASASTSNGGSWLLVSPASSTTPALLTVSVNPASLAPGTYTGTVTVTSSAVSNSPQTRTVTLTVRAASVLSLGTNSMAFTSREGAVPGSQTFSVSSSGDPISFSVSTSNASWLTASPATGTTPATISLSVNPAGLAAGTYTGQVVVQGTGGNSSRQTLDVTLAVTAPLPTVLRVTNAASYTEAAVAPGELVVLFGSNMGPADLATLKLDGAGRVAKNLSDVRVLFSGIEAPVIYASANQVSAVVPYSMAGRSTTSVQVEYRGVRSNSVNMNVATTAPGIFTLNSSGTGAGVVLNQDYSVNSGSNAAARGSIVIVYATGEGQTVPLGVDGGVNNDANNLPAPVLPLTATIDGQPATVHYAGAAPGMVSGVLQLNIEVPATASTGTVPLVINSGGLNSQSGVTLAVR